MRITVLSLGISLLGCLVACDDARPPLMQDDSRAALLQRTNPDRGRQLVTEKGCAACHAVSGVRSPSSNVGPVLDNVARQAYLAGLLPNTTTNLVQWLLDPPAINPRTAMPNVGLQPDEAEDIAAFLLSLP